MNEGASFVTVTPAIFFFFVMLYARAGHSADDKKGAQLITEGRSDSRLRTGPRPYGPTRSRTASASFCTRASAVCRSSAVSDREECRNVPVGDSGSNPLRARRAPWHRYWSVDGDARG